MDLKPCPFCGSDTELIDAPEPMNEGCVVVECTKCHASTCVSYAVKDDPRPVVIDAWNRRHEDAELSRLRTELASAKEELSLVKCGEPNHPDRAYAVKSWLKTFGFKVYAELKHGDVGFVLSLLQEGDISRGKAAEAIAELLVGGKPPLPALIGNTFGEDDFPSETVTKLRAELAAARNSVCAGMAREVKLEAELAAERESKAVLAAALVDLQDAANKLLDLRDKNPRSFTTQVELAWDELRGVLIDLTSGAVRSLEYRDKNQRRKGAAWAVRRIINQFATEHDRPWFEKMLSAIERGEGEVGE